MRQISLQAWMECALSCLKEAKENGRAFAPCERPAYFWLYESFTPDSLHYNDSLADEIRELNDDEQLRVQRYLAQLCTVLYPDQEEIEELEYAPIRDVKAERRARNKAKKKAPPLQRYSSLLFTSDVCA